MFETYRSVSSLTNLNKINHGNLELINLKLKKEKSIISASYSIKKKLDIIICNAGINDGIIILIMMKFH